MYEKRYCLSFCLYSRFLPVAILQDEYGRNPSTNTSLHRVRPIMNKEKLSIQTNTASRFFYSNVPYKSSKESLLIHSQIITNPKKARFKYSSPPLPSPFFFALPTNTNSCSDEKGENAKVFGTPAQVPFKRGTRFYRPTLKPFLNMLLLDAVPLLKVSRTGRPQQSVPPSPEHFLLFHLLRQSPIYAKSEEAAARLRGKICRCPKIFFKKNCKI